MSDSPAREVRSLADLARIVGVSTGTVSRALAGKAIVNPDTMARIQALAAEHRFRPNQMASRLRTRRAGAIGVVVPLGHDRLQHLSDPFFMTMLAHVAEAVTSRGYDVMLSRVIPHAADWLERIVESGMVDGVLLIGQSDQWDTIERVAARYRPLVAWGGRLPGQIHCSVGTDNMVGGRLAGEHLLARGARRIAFMGEVRTPELRLRYEGLRAALAEADPAAARPLQLDTHLASETMDREIGRHIDREGDRIDGIFAASDTIAMTTLRVLADRGIAVPGAVRVVGYDDLPIAELTVPRITTVRQDVAAGAHAMVTALFGRIAGSEQPAIQTRPTLIVRDST